MAGGLIQLAVYGTQDIFLTGTPQITFFKVVYKRHTNFAMESIIQHFIGDANFGTEITAIIEKNGDLMNRVYLEIDLPKVDLVKNFSNWEIDRQNAQKQFEQVRSLYQLIYQYIASNTDMARKLNTLLSTNNISMDDIEKTMENVNFTGQLAKLKYQLQTYISNHEFNNMEYFNQKKFIQQLNQIDLTTIFNSIISQINQLNITPEEKSILKKKHLLYVITKSIYQEMYSFYMEAYNAYLSNQKIYLSMVDNSYQERYKFAWVEEIGHAIIDLVEFRIGGQIMDKHTGDWLILFNKIFLREYQVENYYKMIGNVRELTIFDDSIKNVYKLIIPFQFWFCRSTGLSLPLVALRYHDIIFTIKLKDLSKLCYVEDNPNLYDIPNIQSQYNINIIDAKLYVDYIYLESDERKRFAQSTHEYLVEILQYNEFNNINGSQYSAHTNFAHPTKFVVWFVQPEYYRENIDGKNKCQWNNFGTNPDRTGYSLKSTYLRTNSYARTDPDLNIIYYNYLQPFWYFNRSPTDGFNVYSFAIKPMEHQPSSTINLGRIDDFSIAVIFSNELLELVKNGPNNGIYMGVYAMSYNIFRIIGGMGGMAFQNTT